MLKHINDNEAQQYVDDSKQCDKAIVQHIHACEECKAKVEVYRLMIRGIQRQPQPFFDFDLSQLVLQQLPTPQTKTSNDKWLTWIFIFLGIALIGGALYYFSEYFDAVFKGFGTTILGYLVVVTAATVICVLSIDMFKRYNREMKLLDSY